MASFRILKQFNDPALARAVDRRSRADPRDAALFTGDGPADRIARALCEERTTSFREILEAFEFFAVVRKHVRTARVADLCGGHGLVGALFAAFERRVEQVVILDRSRPGSFDRVMAALERVAPWAPEKIEYATARLNRASDLVSSDAGLVAVHACGDRTDRVLDLAADRGVPVAVMPCCHRAHASPAPRALKDALGPFLAVDVDRTYRMEARGQLVRWGEIPPSITRMNRVLLARPRTEPSVTG